VIRGITGQTANLQQWQNSAGTTMTAIMSDGALRFDTGGTLAIRWGAEQILESFGPTGTLRINPYAASYVGLAIKGKASQTANLQEWQNSAGTVRARVDANGVVFGSTIAGINSLVFLREELSGGLYQSQKLTGAASNPGNGSGKIYFRDGTNAGTLKLVVRAGAAGAETSIIDNIDQTGTDTSTLGVKYIDGGTA
jgi:hypothetical protein